MIPEIYSYIETLILILGGGYFALIGFKLIKPKSASKNKSEKWELWNKKFGTLSKIVGVFIFTYGVLTIFIPDLHAFNFDSESKNQTWTTEQKDEMAKQIIESSYILSNTNSDTANYVANCFVDSYTEKYTLQEAVKHQEIPEKDLNNLTLPLMIECYKKYNLPIKQ